MIRHSCSRLVFVIEPSHVAAHFTLEDLGVKQNRREAKGEGMLETRSWFGQL